MIIQENVILAPYTTFKIGGPARYFSSVRTENELVEAVAFAKKKGKPFLVIGSGSNLLVSDAGYDGLVIKNSILGKKFVDVGVQGVKVEANAGEDWEDLVKEAVGKGLYGMENLSSIPGKVGASAVQNIGAYGVDVSTIIESVRVLDVHTMKFNELSNAQCEFSYRHSIFKKEKHRYIVTRVIYNLKKNGKLDTSYSALDRYLKDNKITNPSLMDVRDAVVAIRKDKLPDWTKWGTAGSFFKNPVITIKRFEELKKKYPGLPGYPEQDGWIKVSLGWILDNICGKKGIVVGNVGTYEKQALVIVSKPGAKASEVVALSQNLINSVMEKTGIKIEAEVEWAVV